MVKKRLIVKICLVAAGLLFLVVILRPIVVRDLRDRGILPAAELSKEEVRQLLRSVQLPESLSPKAMHAMFDEGDMSYSLYVRIHVKGAQADELLDAWLQGASRASSDSENREEDWDWDWA